MGSYNIMHYSERITTIHNNMVQQILYFSRFTSINVLYSLNENTYHSENLNIQARTITKYLYVSAPLTYCNTMPLTLE